MKVFNELGPEIAINTYYCNSDVASIQVSLMTNYQYNNVVVLVDNRYVLKYLSLSE